MMNLRSVGALLAISTVLACATATYDDAVPESPGPGAGAGADNGGGSGLVEEGGAPAGGAPAGGAAPQAGAPGAAGKPGSAGSGNGSGGKPGSAGSGSGGKPGSAGSGGTVGASGAANMGGKAGTSSSGGGSAAGSPGTGGSAGGTTVEPCANPKDVTGGNTGSVGSAGPACFRTKETFNTIGCSNFAGRTLKVNGVLDACDAIKKTFPAMIDGWNYFDVSAGTNTSAGVYWYSS